MRQRTLITTIEVVSRLDIRAPVPVAHASDAHYAVDGLGRRWVHKAAHEYEILGEAIGWLLGNLLEVPSVQSVAVADLEGARGWLSACVPTPRDWDPTASDAVSNPDGLGRILTLDVLILNADRHERNILLEVGEEGLLTALSIDTAAAGLGMPVAAETRRDETLSVERLAEGVRADMVADGMREAAEVAQGLTGQHLAEVSEAACRAANLWGDFDSMTDTLIHRCERADVLVERYLEDLEAREGQASEEL